MCQAIREELVTRVREEMSEAIHDATQRRLSGSISYKDQDEFIAKAAIQALLPHLEWPVWSDAPTEKGWCGWMQMPDMDEPTLAKTSLDEDGELIVKDIDYDLSYPMTDVPDGTKFSTCLPCTSPTEPKEGS